MFNLKKTCNNLLLHNNLEKTSSFVSIIERDERQAALGIQRTHILLLETLGVWSKPYSSKLFDFFATFLLDVS